MGTNIEYAVYKVEWDVKKNIDFASYKISEKLLSEVRDLMGKHNDVIKNIVYPTHDACVFMTYNKVNNFTLPSEISSEKSNFKLIKIQFEIDEIQKVHFQLNRDQLEKLYNGQPESFEVLLNNYALIVNEFYDNDSKAVYFYQADKYLWNLINYLLKQTHFSNLLTNNENQFELIELSELNDYKVNKHKSNKNELFIVDEYKTAKEDKKNTVQPIEIEKINSSVKNDEKLVVKEPFVNNPKLKEIDVKLIDIISASNDILEYEYKLNGLKIEILPGDILKEKVNVIVYPSNCELQLNDRLGESLNKMSDGQLQGICQNLKNYKKIINDGEVYTTSSYLTHCYCVAHAIFPRLLENYKNDHKSFLLMLEKTYFEIFKIAAGATVAIPFELQGIGNEVCTEKLYSALRSYVEQIDISKCAKSIKILTQDIHVNKKLVDYFIENLATDYNINPKKVKTPSPKVKLEEPGFTVTPAKKSEIKEQIESALSNMNASFQTSFDTNSIEIKENTKNKCLIYTYKSSSLTIAIFQGNLVEQQVDAIVNAANSSLQIQGMSGVSGAIDRKAGSGLQIECDDLLRKMGFKELRDADVVDTRSYMNTCKYIIHAVGPAIFNYHGKHDVCFSLLEETYFRIFEHSERLKLTSIALPLISSGVFGVPKKICCEKLYAALERYLSIYASILSLKLIKIPSIDTETNTEIVSYFSERLSKSPAPFVESVLETLKNVKKVGEENKNNDDNASNDSTLDPYQSVYTDNDDSLKESVIKTSVDDYPIGKCVMCQNDNVKLYVKLECSCQYCRKCSKNFTSNGNQCECPQPDAENPTNKVEK